MPLPDTATLDRRQSRVRATLDELNLDAIVVIEPANIRFLCNHVGSAGVLVLTRADSHLLIDFRYEESVRALQESAAASPRLRHAYACSGRDSGAHRPTIDRPHGGRT